VVGGAPPDDVHSPHQHSFLWSHMFWITTRENFKTNLVAVPDLAKYRELRWLDRFDLLVPVALGAGMMLLGMALEHWAPSLGTNGLQMLVWGFFISTTVLFHATCTINSLAHLIGRKRFRTKDQSRNNLFLAFLTLGEGWHNNHHHYPASVRQGFFWWEVDITYYMLWTMARLGLIWDLQPVPARVYQRAKDDAQAREKK
jgi:stearoyl-CoA desaturase (delta-9 desaturase)